MIKVVLLIPTLDHHGAEKQLTLLAAGLPRDDFDVHVVVLTRTGPYESVLRDQGIPVTVLNKRLKFDPVAFWKLRQLVARLRPDIVHCWLFAANAYGRMLAGPPPAPRVVVSERCVDVWKRGWQIKIDRWQFGRTARLVGNSQSVAKFYRDLGFPEERMVVIPNGVEIPGPPSRDRAEVLAEFDIPAGARVVGYVGRFSRQKRVHDLVWAMQLLHQLTDNVYFLLVGDGSERKSIFRFARHLGCDRLIRLTGHREDASALMQAMDVFWLASEFEGLSNSVMEAMAAGLPVVASDIPPNRELVVDGETGFLANVGDGVGLAQFADRLLADPELAGRMGNAGRERMRTQFGVPKMVDAYGSLYRNVLEEK